MSATIDVLHRQRILACAGFYAGKLDADWGPKTEQADKDAHAEYLRLQRKYGPLDPRSEGVIATLLPKAQLRAREFMKAAGPNCKLLSGTRTYAEQNALYERGRSIKSEKDAKGRTVKVSVVTNARGGFSNHNFAFAWDVGIFDGGQYLTGKNAQENKAYADLAKQIKAKVPGLEWGGDWASLIDMPHYQLVTGKTLSAVRAAFEAGKSFI